MQTIGLSTFGMIYQEFTNKKRKGLVRKFRGVARLAANFSTYVAFLRVMAHPHIMMLTRRHPGLLSKCLRSDYLARSFRTDTRLNILIHHYGHLKERAKRDFLRQVYSEGYILWREWIGEHAFCIELAFPKEHDYEGDLCLVFKYDAAAIYTITFTLVPGRAVHLGAGQALLISNLQGVAGTIDLMRQATKLCHDTAPVHLLLAAAQAIALSLEANTIVGLGQDEQISLAFSDPDDPGFVFDYDRFWRSYTSKVAGGRYYAVDVPFPEKPISDIKPKHRSRGIRRRELRKRIFDQVSDCFAVSCLERRQEVSIPAA